ncbi:pyruvate dehydrogenase phosphatase regulatory subunit, mitochondrial isoform X2 [Lingula anatina]|uniref:Pyruvate dehydrogenase phosphatase regulatory subunit, mitochondrial isoform X2 n=2 Tax=Lingula anatina TaxID=7574 RepID=A0A1S3K186_LINAN|nr:pyruvate dehydrogenase phosphatase regulatory subunit, mitochondrial isoform X2 [Lingula anatina]|eukprot:XP_013416036.1 pyruvate dehydrogenase phosphatase regulatory subunit, mitochondrial isoform X2 [Lingula anatina]
MLPLRSKIRLGSGNVKKTCQKLKSGSLSLRQEHKHRFLFTRTGVSSAWNHDGRVRQASTSAESSVGLPDQARVVICGGGVIGTSVAYHLAELGWSDVVLLEQGSLSCGTTWHSSGVLIQSVGHPVVNRSNSYSCELYKKLQNAGHALGFKPCGSISIARTHDRMVAMKRNAAVAKTIGLECHEITPKEALDLAPLLRTDDIEYAQFFPTDGAASPSDIVNTFARLAKQKGVKVIEKCQVNQVLTDEKHKEVRGVDTNLGTIRCEYFVNCAGQWGRELGKRSEPRVRVPLHSCEHYHLVTKPFGVDPMMPVIRDPDGAVYFREWSGGILAGGFEPTAKAVFHEHIPEKFEFQLLQEDWDHFQILLDQILHRIPAMESAEVRQLTNGPESFSPDGRAIVGECPEIRKYFVAAGMSSLGIVSAGGIGHAVAEWIVNGEPTWDLWAVDVKRFVDLHNNKKFLRDRVKEVLGTTYSIPYPECDYRSSRKLRTSPLYPILLEQGAVYGSTMGFERPLYFEEQTRDKEYLRYSYARTPPLKTKEYTDNTIPRLTFYRPSWFDAVASEYWACKEGVGLFDMSYVTKIELKSAGTEVVDFLQKMCSNDIDKPVGTVIHTGVHNHKGGYENDCSLARVAENCYMMISLSTTQTRAYNWLSQHLPANGSVILSDVSSMYTTLNVIGPKAKDFLHELAEIPLHITKFPSMTVKTMYLGHASGIKAMRLTHTGDDGWMLYIPSEYALHVYDTLISSGHDYGLKNVGLMAHRSLRIEKYLAYWGIDLDSNSTPLECGRDFRVKKNKPFIGQEALLKQKEEGIKKRFVQLLVEDHDNHSDPWPWGGEPIYRNGKFAGMTTSAAYGFSLESHICLGYVQDFTDNTGNRNIINENWVMDPNAKYEIDIAGRRFPVKVGISAPKSPYMPTQHNLDDHYPMYETQ